MIRVDASQLAAEHWASHTSTTSVASPTVEALAARLLSHSRDGLGVRFSALASASAEA